MSNYDAFKVLNTVDPSLGSSGHRGFTYWFSNYWVVEMDLGGAPKITLKKSLSPG